MLCGVVGGVGTVVLGHHVVPLGGGRGRGQAAAPQGRAVQGGQGRPLVTVILHN